MKAIVKIGRWKAIAFLAVVIISFIFIGCSPGDNDDNVPIPPPVTENTVIVLKPVINIGLNNATLVGTIVPNQPNTVLTFQYRLSTDIENWHDAKVLKKFTGKDSVQITLDIDNLESGQTYLVIANAKNEAGTVVSNNYVSFSTYGAKDYDGNLYHTVKIGNQVWLQENFKGTHFANGDAIPNVTDQTEWSNMTTPAYCWYNNDPKIGETYGGLYNFYVANDSRGLIVGFHTPSLDEFAVLSNYLGGNNVAGGKMKEAGYAHWIQPNAGATNSSGFNGLPSGCRQDKFSNLGDWAVFWSTTPFGIPGIASATELGEIWANFRLDGGSYFHCGYNIRLVKN